MINRKNLLLVLCLLFILDVIVTIVGAVMLDLPKFYGLTSNAGRTDGTVTSKERENHMSIRFEYEANGRKFTSLGRAEDLNTTFDQIEVGAHVPVSYDPSNPAFAILGDPRRYFYSSLRGTIFIFTGLIVCTLLYVLTRTG